jgi:hypothetical protein
MIYNDTLQLLWDNEVQLTIDPDLDADMISDHEDVVPFIYNPDGMDLDPDATWVNCQIDVGVALDYENNLTMKPIIIEETNPPKSLIGGIDTFASITTIALDNFSALIKFRYDADNMYRYINETYLRMYTYSDGNWTLLENTGINMMHHYVWGITDHFSLFTIADYSSIDSNNNGLPDAWDPPLSENKRLTIYTDESTSPSVYVDEYNKFYLVWAEKRNGLSQIFFKRSLDFGESWEVDTPIASAVGVFWIRNVDFGADGSHLAVVWEEKWIQDGVDEYGNPIIVDYYQCFYIESFDGGDTWSTPERVAPDDPPPDYPTGSYVYYAQFPSVYVKGEFVYISYLEYYIYIPGIQGPDWRIHEFVVLTWRSSTESYRKEFFDVYSDQLGGGSNIGVDANYIHVIIGNNSKNKLYYFKSEDHGASWNPEVILSDSYVGPEYPISIDFFVKDINLYLAWSQMAAINFMIYYRDSGDNGITWTQTRLLTIPPQGAIPTDYLSPALIVDSENNVYMTYQWQTAYASNIMLAKFLPTHDLMNFDIAFNEVPVSGDVFGSYLDTHFDDGLCESIGEVAFGDPSTMETFSYLEHKWVLDVTKAYSHTFYLKASATGVDDGEHFLFQYSTDDNVYKNLVAVDFYTLPDYYQSVILPMDLEGLIYIRVVDSNKYWLDNEIGGAIYIDHMYIESKSSSLDYIVEATPISKNGIAPLAPAIALDVYENFYVAWQDYRELDWEVFWVTEAKSKDLDIDETIVILESYPTEAFNNSLFGDSELMKELIGNKLEILASIIKSKDYSKALYMLEADIADVINYGIINQGLKSRVGNELTGIGNDLMGAPMTPSIWISNDRTCPYPTDIYECVDDYVVLSWAHDPDDEVPQGYNLYKCNYQVLSYYCGGGFQVFYVGDSTTYVDTNVQHGGFGYTYYVTAYNAAGESDGSDLVRVLVFDTINPGLSTDPIDGQVNVITTPTIYVGFNELMDSGSLSFELTIYGDDTPIIGSLTWNPPYTSMSFVPDSELSTSTVYEARVFALDHAGNPVAEDQFGNPIDYIWTFCTEHDPDDLPMVWWTVPSEDKTDIDLNDNIVVKFTRDMNTNSVENAFSFTEIETGLTWFGSDPLSGSFSWYDGDTRFIFDPANDFSDGHLYEVKIEATAKSKTGCIGDLGCFLADDYIWEFSTALNAPVLNAPMLTSSEIVLEWDWDSSWSLDNSKYDFEVLKDGNSIWETDSNSYIVDSDLSPHAYYDFQIRVYNTFAIYASSNSYQVKISNIEYFLDVGSGDGYDPDQTIQKRKGLSLSHFWSADDFTDPEDGTNYRKQWTTGDPFDLTTPTFDFYIEVFNPNNPDEVWAENHVNYALSFRYKASASNDVYLQGNQIGTIEGNNAWKISTVVVDHDYYSSSSFYADPTTGLYCKTLHFRFGTDEYPHWLLLDWIEMRPYYYFTDVGSIVNFENIGEIYADYNIGAHSPGISLYPNDWGNNDDIYYDNGEEYRTGISTGGRLYLNVPHYYYGNEITVEYRTSTNGEFGLWDGSSYMGTTVPVVGDQNWNSLVFVSDNTLYPSYEDYGNTHLNAILKFSAEVDVKSIKMYSFGGDADGDELSDWEELNDGDHITDPTNPDTDNDGLSDGLEVNGWQITVDDENELVKSNPLTKHSDGDGLDDYVEYRLTKTAPMEEDTDGDELTDDFEVYYDYYPFQNGIQGTSPIYSDSDDDDLLDGIEYGDFDPYTFGYQGLSPLSKDTDGDGTEDFNEVFIVDQENVGKHPGLVEEFELLAEVELGHTELEGSSFPVWLPETITWSGDGGLRDPHFITLQGNVESGTFVIKDVLLRGGDTGIEYSIDKCVVEEECMTRWMKSEDGIGYTNMFIFDHRGTQYQYSMYSISFKYRYIIPPGPTASAWVKVTNDYDSLRADRRTWLRALDEISFENGLEAENINGGIEWVPAKGGKDLINIQSAYFEWFPGIQYKLDHIVEDPYLVPETCSAELSKDDGRSTPTMWWYEITYSDGGNEATQDFSIEQVSWMQMEIVIYELHAGDQMGGDCPPTVYIDFHINIPQISPIFWLRHDPSGSGNSLTLFEIEFDGIVDSEEEQTTIMVI